MTLDYDIIVIGGGHAGCEAASAAARLGSRTLLLTMDMAKLAAMSCNPAVGGVAKGQIVREIDALGGQMGRITDLTTIQFRMLNRSKGAAMWSPRAQCDKTRFSEEWRRTLENTWNLYIWQDAATELLFDERLKQAIDTAREQYDYVLIDCPPIELVADTQIIEKLADRTIFVIRAGLLERSMLVELEKIYDEKKYKNMSMILNGTEESGGRYGYGYRYGYHYGYGSGYHYGSDEKPRGGEMAGR